MPPCVADRPRVDVAVCVTAVVDGVVDVVDVAVVAADAADAAAVVGNASEQFKLAAADAAAVTPAATKTVDGNLCMLVGDSEHTIRERWHGIERQRQNGALIDAFLRDSCDQLYFHW